MEGRHRQVVCAGTKCMLSTPGYYSDLCDVTIHVVKSATWRLGFNRKVTLRFSSHPPSRFPLNDASLHDNNEISLYGQCDDEVIAVYREVIAVLIERIRDRRGCCDTDLELLLWCAVSVGDIDTLTTTLRSTRDFLPPCLLASLLLRAIELYFDRGVQVLLECGASPNVGLSLNGVDRPLAKAIQLAEDGLDLQLNDGNLREKPLSAIFRSLVAFGGDLLEPIERHTNAIALHKVAYLAIHAAEAAKTIVDATPPQGYEAESESVDEVAYSPLAMALRDVSWMDVNCSLSTARLARIFKFAIVPMLKAGAILSPDPFDSEVIDGCLLTFCQPSPATDQMNAALWGRPNNAIIELVLEARRKSSLNVAKLERSLSNLAYALPDEEAADDVLSFGDLIRQQLPRRLQALCRVAILRHLPAGANARPAAIEKLNLPSCLSSYLNFNEFDVLIAPEVEELPQQQLSRNQLQKQTADESCCS